jgi:lipoprotein-releasing system ATP-binding protein
VVFDMMLELNARIGTALVMVTHDIGLANKMDKVYHLEAGSLRLE